ncbi:uncharacterized protein LOC122672123 [Telopea speciosissima]|uniref:uncharacterized protein LOC122672123 n=1 Tax=Telopea speciosissima TaxID=54955 RepID=UPI001CC376F6|nr:uncharacterized protein LOC122672123 [Telopea speciosissima]
MESIGVVMMYPFSSYLEEELDKRFKLFRCWQSSNQKEFLKENSNSIRALVGNATVGADAETIDILPKLEIVSNYSVGLDKVDLVKCKEKGIRVTNTPDVLTDDVADLAIGLIIGTLRKISESDRYVRSGLWVKGDYRLTTKFSGKSVGILGLGRIGTAIAKRAEAFSCPISYYSRSEKPNTNYKYYPSVLELAKNCQILVIACPLTKETYHIVNREVIEAVGPKGIIVNIGRGPHINEPELVSALIEGRLGGAGLDVFENEPNVPEQLFGLDNVVLLPHVGSGTLETRKDMADLVIGNLEAYFLNKPLLTPGVRSENVPYQFTLSNLSAKRSEGSNEEGTFGCHFFFFFSFFSFIFARMESIGVALMYPFSSYLEEELDKRFKLFRCWKSPNQKQFLKENSNSIRALVGNASVGADAETINILPKLKIVSNHGVGLDKVDLVKCKEKGIRVTNTPDVLTDDVADLAIGLIIGTLRKICESDHYVRSGLWVKGDYKLTTKFSGKSVGILGLGRIGSAIAKRAEAFDCPISYYSRSEKPNTNYKYHPSVLELAKNCQILVIACPLTKETYHIVNREVIEAVGPKGIIVNIGRGPHIDEPELVSALIEGRLGGAGLDVFENEPHVPEQLFGLDNVVLLPHVGTQTFETRKDMADIVIRNLEAYFLNRPLLTPVV